MGGEARATRLLRPHVQAPQDAGALSSSAQAGSPLGSGTSIGIMTPSLQRISRPGSTACVSDHSVTARYSLEKVPSDWRTRRQVRRSHAISTSMGCVGICANRALTRPRKLSPIKPGSVSIRQRRISEAQPCARHAHSGKKADGSRQRQQGDEHGVAPRVVDGGKDLVVVDGPQEGGDAPPADRSRTKGRSSRRGSSGRRPCVRPSRRAASTAHWDCEP